MSFTRYAGVVWQTASVAVIADQAQLYFYVRDDGELVLLERESGTWSERYEKQVRREQARR